MKKKAANLAVPAIICLGILAGIFEPSSAKGFSATVSAVSDSTKLEKLLLLGDSLRREYRFEASITAYEKASELAPDSIARQRVEDQALPSKNGLNMLDYCSRPTVIARERFSLEDFFLYYPLPEKSWRPLPNPLDTVKPSDLVKASFIPDDATSLYFSTADADGIRNLYRTHFADSLWEVPELLGEHLTSSGNEIFPMLSPDGKSLFFASDGLFGMGGYDLYVSHWNESLKDWDIPENLGFPYSSPYDDFLYINTPDGKYSIFASNRACSRDSVYVYVLAYDTMPVHFAYEDASDDIRNLAALMPQESHVDNSSLGSWAGEDETQLEYIRKALEIKHLRDSVRSCMDLLDDARAEYASAQEAEKQALSGEIQAMELSLTSLQDTLNKANRRLQKLEMDIILAGKNIDFDKVQALADKEVKGAAGGYAFSANKLGPVPDFVVRKPKPTFDYSFMILPEGRFAEDNTLPDGLVYQIQLFTRAKQATVADLKGLSPVFWRKNAAGRYVYGVGVFRSYNDVLSNLNKVKKAGFKAAFITAFMDGTPINVATARSKEKAVK